MGYRNLAECVGDLERHGALLRIECEIDPYLEVGAVQRRVYQAGGPALLFTRVKGCTFPMLANLFGTLERTRFLFRDTLDAVSRLVQLRTQPAELLKNPLAFHGIPRAVWHLLPRKVSDGPILTTRTTIEQLPQLVSWPRDGGAFITLPVVYSESLAHPGFRRSNMGMYRVQLSGGSYCHNEEIGLHYQIQRGIAVHHAEAIAREVTLPVVIIVGGPPALTVAAVMPLPEGMPELAFAGLLGGRRIALACRPGQLPVPAEADFCIYGFVDPLRTLPEGPFGDHLGYYSLCHDFPVVRVSAVYHRPGAIWPFTTVGRPPQEDTSFGAFIHELTGPLLPTVIAGLHAVHAVDAAGVHPLLLAIGSERYVPYDEEREPRELLTIANALLGQGQLALAKYLLIVAREDNPDLSIHRIDDFLRHLLERVNWQRDLHFQTCTTMDTLDYSGTSLNEGSKVVIAAAGPIRRTLATLVPRDITLPSDFGSPRLCLPGVLAVQGPVAGQDQTARDGEMGRLSAALVEGADLSGIPLIVVVDDSDFVARSMNNVLWVTFTRSDPARDIHGVLASMSNKHWGCAGPLIIDARLKPHHAPPLTDDPDIELKVDALGAPGGPLHGII